MGKVISVVNQFIFFEFKSIPNFGQLNHLRMYDENFATTFWTGEVQLFFLVNNS